MTKSDMMVSKVFSARFIVTILLVSTACILSYQNKFPDEAFVGLVTLAVNGYFNRHDRGSESGKPTA